MDTKGCGQLTSRYTYFSDIYFSGVETAEGGIAEILYYCRLVKTSHNSFCMSTLEKLMKDWPGGWVGQLTMAHMFQDQFLNPVQKVSTMQHAL